jgi:hypothetical protein
MWALVGVALTAASVIGWLAPAGLRPARAESAGSDPRLPATMRDQ